MHTNATKLKQLFICSKLAQIEIQQQSYSTEKIYLMYIGEPIALRVLGGEATRKKISFSCILGAILGPIFTKTIVIS